MVKLLAENTQISKKLKKFFEKRRIGTALSLIPSTNEPAYALDMGRAFGILAESIIRKRYLYVGFDISREQIKITKSISKFIDFSIAYAHHISRVRVAEKWHTLYTKLVRV